MREKMLYAATRATLTKELGDNLFVDSMYGTTMDEFTLTGYLKHQKHQKSATPLTAQETTLMEVKKAEVCYAMLCYAWRRSTTRPSSHAPTSLPPI